MQRVAALSLIALVGLMALLPQAICPCPGRARGESAAQARGSSAPITDCCPLCKARRAQTRFVDTPAPGRGAPPYCPCCVVNGAGKDLLLPGDVVQPEQPASSGLLAALATLLVGAAPVVDAGGVAHHAQPPDIGPPAELRAGVVLLI